MTTLKNQPTQWDGPVSKAYLAFNSMVSEVRRNLRNLLEMMIMAMLCGQDIWRYGRKSDYWISLATR